MKGIRSVACGAALFLALVLQTVALRAASLTEDQQGFFEEPKIAVPAVIDGRIDPRERSEARAIEHLTAQNPGDSFLAMRPTTIFVALDAENIHLTGRSWTMPICKPHMRGRAVENRHLRESCGAGLHVGTARTRARLYWQRLETGILHSQTRG